MYSLKNKPVMDDAILEDSDNSIVILLFTRQVLIARRWQEFYHNLHPSRIDCQLARRRNLPWGQPLLLPWTLHCGGVLNAGNDCLFGKHFRRGPVKTCRGGNTCMTSSKDNRVSIPPKRFRFALSDVQECQSYLHLI